MRSKETCEGGPGGALEIIDEFCKITENLVNVIKEQDVMIKQARIMGIMFENDYDKQKENAIEELDSIERKLRKI